MSAEGFSPFTTAGIDRHGGDGSWSVGWSHPDGLYGNCTAYFRTHAAAKDFMLRLSSRSQVDLHRELEHATAQVESLRRDRDELADMVSVLRLQAWDPDPDAPPIPCIRLGLADGVPIWRAMGDDVRDLGPEWEFRAVARVVAEPREFVASNDDGGGKATASASVYQVRRAVTEELVPWWEARGRELPGGTLIDAVGTDAHGVWFGSGEMPVLRGLVDDDGLVKVRPLTTEAPS